MEQDVYFKHGFGLKSAVRPALEKEYHSGLIAQMKESGHRLVRGEVTILLAQEFGFCYGVDKAVDYAYETRMKFPDQNVYLTSEIIHNPSVNKRLEEMGVRFLPTGKGRFDGLTQKDVVIIPAFGVTTGEMETLTNFMSGNGLRNMRRMVTRRLSMENTIMKRRGRPAPAPPNIPGGNILSS